MQILELVIWDKRSFGRGYRTRRPAEYSTISQRRQRRAKGNWTFHSVTNVVSEKVRMRPHQHQERIYLQGDLLTSVSNERDLVIDPAAGSSSVMETAIKRGRTLPGSNLNG